MAITSVTHCNAIRTCIKRACKRDGSVGKYSLHKVTTGLSPPLTCLSKRLVFRLHFHCRVDTETVSVTDIINSPYLNVVTSPGVAQLIGLRTKALQCS